MNFYALLFCLAVASLYVLAIRVHVPPRLACLDRNAPELVRFRFWRISLLCVFTVLFVPWVNWALLGLYPSYILAIRQLGLVPGFSLSGSVLVDSANIAKTTLKMALLYIGPLAQYALSKPDLASDLASLYLSVWGFRDHVFGPITEELVYRAAVVSVLLPIADAHKITIWAPSLFGVAHLHHGIQLLRDGVPLTDALAQVAFQFIYTTLFGILANYVYLSTQCNLWCAVAMHAAANLGSFPSFELRHKHPRLFIVYCASLVAGAVSFYKLL